jgi:hypothetical protein
MAEISLTRATVILGEAAKALEGKKHGAKERQPGMRSFGIENWGGSVARVLSYPDGCDSEKDPSAELSHILRALVG